MFCFVMIIFKLQIGREREVAVCLMQKAVDRGSDFKIRSVIALDHLQNFIYIEADMEAHVKEVYLMMAAKVYCYSFSD